MKIISTLTVAIVVSVSLSISAASAVDFKAEIRGLDGKPIPVSETDKTPVTLGSVAEVALLAAGGIENSTPEEKARRFFLALKIHEGRGDTLTLDELALVKRVIGSVYGPLIYGRAVELLELKVVQGGGGGCAAGATDCAVAGRPNGAGGGGGGPAAGYTRPGAAGASGGGEKAR